MGRLAIGVLLAMSIGSSAVGETPGKAPPPPLPPATPAVAFADVTEAAGVAFRHPHAPEKRYILESVSGGVAVVDFDRDGWLDLYLVNSQTVATAKQKRSSSSALYRNTTGEVGAPLRFVERGRRAGVAATDWGVGVCAGDVDGNGYPDLYVTGVGRNWLFLNRDGSTFEDATEAAGVLGGGWSTGCAMADTDRDGDLDLFVARYLDMDLDNLPAFGRGELCQYRGIPVQCGPRGLPGQSDLFFRNDGPVKGADVRFREVSADVGLDDPKKGFGLGATFVDLDGDGWQDLYVANDTTANFLYVNRKDGTFEEMAHLFGAAVTEDGKEQGSMGIAVGDYRNAGWPSLFVTNFSEEYNVFYHSHEGGYFTDASFRTGLAAPSVRTVGWGTSFADVDNDGWLDLPLLNGHVYPQIDAIELEASAPYKQPGMLFRQRPDGRFEEAASPGDPMARDAVARGLAIGDLDRDGRLDLVITDLDAPARILRNTTATDGHWLTVRLEGSGRMREAIGARITVHADGQAFTRWVRSGTSYLSQDPFEQHIGLGTATAVDRIEVRWPDGSTSTHPDVGIDQTITLQHP